jgi:hypothetical protein
MSSFRALPTCSVPPLRDWVSPLSLGRKHVAPTLGGSGEGEVVRAGAARQVLVLNGSTPLADGAE